MAYALGVRPTGGRRTWRVIDSSYRTVSPVPRSCFPNQLRAAATNCIASGIPEKGPNIQRRPSESTWTASGFSHMLLMPTLRSRFVQRTISGPPCKSEGLRLSIGLPVAITCSMSSRMRSQAEACT